MFKVFNTVRTMNYINRSISICRILQNEDIVKSKGSKKKVTETVELIRLVDQNDKILGLKPKKECELLAKKLNLSLERVTDPKFGKAYPAYKMFSSAELLKGEKKTSNAKVLKKLPLNNRISERDLSIKLETVKKWLAKDCEVHIAIVGNSASQATMKNVFSQIQEQLKDEVRILNIRNKEEAIKFILMPPKQPPKKDVSKDDDKEESLPQQS